MNLSKSFLFGVLRRFQHLWSYLDHPDFDISNLLNYRVLWPYTCSTNINHNLLLGKVKFLLQTYILVLTALQQHYINLSYVKDFYLLRANLFVTLSPY